MRVVELVEAGGESVEIGVEVVALAAVVGYDIVAFYVDHGLAGP